LRENFAVFRENMNKTAKKLKYAKGERLLEKVSPNNLSSIYVSVSTWYYYLIRY